MPELAQQEVELRFLPALPGLGPNYLSTSPTASLLHRGQEKSHMLPARLPLDPAPILLPTAYVVPSPCPALWSSRWGQRVSTSSRPDLLGLWTCFLVASLTCNPRLTQHPGRGHMAEAHGVG